MEVFMIVRFAIPALTGLAIATAAFIFPAVHIMAPAYAACEPGEKIDKSTADDARKKLTKAGFPKLTDLKKGCDSFWHATALKGNDTLYLALSPQGEVMIETAR